MTDDKIVIATTPNYWQKTKITIGIVKPDPTPQISGKHYVRLAREAISMWNDALYEYSKKTSHEHLRKIQFKISENLKGDEDVLVQWWHSDRGNGRTFFEQDKGKIKRSSIFIAKYFGPHVTSLTADDTDVSFSLVIHTSDEIRSIVLHELGHVLGLGHCNYKKDLMAASTTSRIDTKRRISSLDMDVISQLFRGYFEKSSTVMITHMIPKFKWEPINNNSKFDVT